MLHRELSKAEVYMAIVTLSIQLLIWAAILTLDHHIEKQQRAMGINIEEMLKR